MTLAEMCKAIRKEMGLSQSGLAELVGSSQTEISLIENRGLIAKPHKANAIRDLAEKNGIMEVRA